MAKENLESKESVDTKYVDRQWLKLKKLAQENHMLTEDGGNLLLRFRLSDVFGNHQQCCLYDYENNTYKRLGRNRGGIYYIEYGTTGEKYDTQQEVISHEEALKVIKSFFEKVEEIKRRNIEKQQRKTAKSLAEVLDN